MFKKLGKIFPNFKPATGLLVKSVSSICLLAITTPILTRAYEPTQFGTLSLLIFFGSIVSIFSTLRLDVSIPYTKSVFELVTLVVMCFFSTLIFVFITVILVLVVSETKSIALPDQYDGNWFFGVPILGFCLALTSIMHMTLLRIKRYNIAGTLALIQNTVFAFVALLTAQIHLAINGLIIAKIFGVIASLIFGACYFLKFPIIKLIMRSIARIQSSNLIVVYKKYLDFILYNMPLSLFGILTRDVMVVLLSLSHGIEYAGLYSLARIVQEVPINLLSGSLGVLFLGETAEGYAKRQIPYVICDQIRLIFLFVVSVFFPIYLFCAFWAVELFTLIFGGSWAASGFIFMILMPYGIISLLSSWQVRVFEALGKQRYLFKYQIIFESSGIFAGFWMSSQGYDYNTIIAVSFSFFACVPIFITLTCATAIGISRAKVYLLGALMLLLSIGNAYFLIQGPVVNIGDSYFAWLMILGTLFGFFGWLCFGVKKLN